jgi:hypothetical protein
MSETKRRSPRYNVKLNCTWTTSSATTHLIGTGANAHGFFLRTERDIPLGELMKIDVVLPDGPQRFIVSARFIGTSAEGRGVGVEIFVANEAARRSWARFLQSLSQSKRRAPELTAAA